MSLNRHIDPTSTVTLAAHAHRGLISTGAYYPNFMVFTLFVQCPVSHVHGC